MAAKQRLKRPRTTVSDGPDFLPGQQEWFHGCLIHCVDVAENEDAIDSSAPVLDHMIVTHLKSRYRMYFVYMHG